jgi:hypothetical protein
MLAWIIQITIISFIFIFLIDHLIKFFTNTLTVPKIKDLVNNPHKKYESIYQILLNSKNIKEDSTDIFSLPINSLDENNSNSNFNLNSNENMKNELKNFFKNQLNFDNVDENKNNNNNENLNPEYFQFTPLK